MSSVEGGEGGGGGAAHWAGPRGPRPHGPQEPSRALARPCWSSSAFTAAGSCCQGAEALESLPGAEAAPQGSAPRQGAPKAAPPGFPEPHRGRQRVSSSGQGRSPGGLRRERRECQGGGGSAAVKRARVAAVQTAIEHNGHINGHNGHVNGHNGHVNGHNGHAPLTPPRRLPHRRRSSSAVLRRYAARCTVTSSVAARPNQPQDRDHTAPTLHPRA